MFSGRNAAGGGDGRWGCSSGVLLPLQVPSQLAGEPLSEPLCALFRSVARFRDRLRGCLGSVAASAKGGTKRV